MNDSKPECSSTEPERMGRDCLLHDHGAALWAIKQGRDERAALNARCAELERRLRESEQRLKPWSDALAVLRNVIHEHCTTDACTGEPTCWCIDCEAMRKVTNMWELPVIDNGKRVMAVAAAAVKWRAGVEDEPALFEPGVVALVEAVDKYKPQAAR